VLRALTYLEGYREEGLARSAYGSLPGPERSRLRRMRECLFTCRLRLPVGRLARRPMRGLPDEDGPPFPAAPPRDRVPRQGRRMPGFRPRSPRGEGEWKLLEPCGPSAPTTSTRRSTGSRAVSPYGVERLTVAVLGRTARPVPRRGWSCTGWPLQGRLRIWSSTVPGPGGSPDSALGGDRLRHVADFFRAKRSCASVRSPVTDPGTTSSDRLGIVALLPGAAPRRRRRGRWTACRGGSPDRSSTRNGR